MFGNRKFKGLGDSAFLFFQYLIQYEKNNCAGVFRATASQLSAESEDRWTPAKCRELLEALVNANLVRADGDWIWVIGSFKRAARNPRAYASARTALIRCRAKMIFDAWFTKYGAADNVDKWVGPVTFRGEVADPEAVVGQPSPLDPIKASPNLMREEVETVWDFYQQTMLSHADLTPKRKKKILTRLTETIFDPQTGNKRRVTTGDLMLAISNCTKSDWHMGRDPKTNGHKYNSQPFPHPRDGRTDGEMAALRGAGQRGAVDATATPRDALEGGQVERQGGRTHRGQGLAAGHSAETST